MPSAATQSPIAATTIAGTPRIPIATSPIKKAKTTAA